MDFRSIILFVFALAGFGHRGEAQNSFNSPGFETQKIAISAEPVFASEAAHYTDMARTRAAKSTGRINLFIFSYEKKFNLSSFAMQSSTKISRLFNKKIKIIYASSAEEMADRVEALMEKHADQMIGHLWFDSHGRYKAGRAQFNIGKDTIYYYKLNDPALRAEFLKLTAYCDEQTQITIGACYASADFNRPGNDKIASRIMDGDSLMRAIASVFSISGVYATDSWVMTRPFMFGRKWALAGYPLENKFRDEIYKPVWERMGNWKTIEPGSSAIKPIHTAYLTGDGGLAFNERDYLSSMDNQKKMKKKVAKLKPGLYHLDDK
jgi:hypothetical protein